MSKSSSSSNVNGGRGVSEESSRRMLRSSSIAGLGMNEAAANSDAVMEEVVTMEIPCWFEEEKDQEEQEDPLFTTKRHPRRKHCLVVEEEECQSSQSSYSSCLLFDDISEEVSALILSHLSFAEISAASLVSRRLYRHCRSNALWKLLCEYRWNVKQQHHQQHQRSDCDSYYYFEGYRTAHSHPHDLWITHSNCVFPSDGLSPGRCCIIDTSTATTTNNNKRCTRKKRPPPKEDGSTTISGVSSASTLNTKEKEHVCPYCRDWDDLDQADLPSSTNTAASASAAPSTGRTTTTITTPAQEMARATRQTKRKFENYPKLLCQKMDVTEDDDNNHNDPLRDASVANASTTAQERAFAAASTFHRKLDTRQYYSAHAASRPPTFLTDLLFFNLTDPIHSDGQWELEQLLQEVATTVMNENSNDGGDDDNDSLLFMDQNPHHNNKYNHETSHHSWHMIQLTNPDFYRPLVFQFGIQRPECFTVYPSEGYLAPGQSAVVTVGVRPLGSALAYAFEALNAQREGLQPPEWAELYTRQAHLPLAPFLVRYRFTASNPVYIQPPSQPPSSLTSNHNDLNNDPARRPNNQNNNNDNRGRNIDNNNNNNSNNNAANAAASNTLLRHNESTLAFHWEQPVPAHQIHSIHLSAHVHAHYSFDKFLQETCHVWDNTSTMIGHEEEGMILRTDGNDDDSQHYYYPPLVAPALHERFPAVYQQLAHYPLRVSGGGGGHDNKTNGYSNSLFYSRSCPLRRFDFDSLTEGPCPLCRRCWGVREEELVHAYIVMRGECEWQRERRQILLNNVSHCLRWINDGPQQPEDVTFLAALLYKITCILQEIKGAPWLGPRQRRLVLQLEAGVDQLYYQLPQAHKNGNSNTNNSSNNNNQVSSWTPWRVEGVYRYALCTDSVFGGTDQSSSLDNRNDRVVAVWKDEPGFLDSFRHLAHSPGLFCLGPQEDPNHLGHLGQTGLATSKRYFRVQKFIISDLLMDDAISALQAGICMMYNTTSLLVHGLYDRIPYPGTIARRPKLLPPHLLKPQASVQLLSMLLLTEPTQECCNSIIDRVIYYHWQNALDLPSILFSDAASMYQMALLSTNVLHVSMENYIEGVPPPGSGRFALSRVANGRMMMQGFRPDEQFASTTTATGQAQIVPVEFAANRAPPPSSFKSNSSGGSRGEGGTAQAAVAPALGRVQPPPPPRPRNIPNARPGPRFLQLLLHLGANMGLSVVDGPAASVFVDRRILIATQWLCVSLMASPLLLTLFARYAQWIPSRPIEYELQGLPFEVGNEMRYLTPHECGVVAVLLVLIWLAVGRWTERHLCRDFFRIMLDHITPSKERGFVRRIRSSISLFVQRQWDAFCPLFLQRRVFVPDWNRRSRADLVQHISFWKSQNLPEQRAAARAMNIFQVFGGGSGDCRDRGLDVGNESTARNLVVGIVVALGSFCSSTPHFWLNLFTVFSCSIGLGISVSLHLVEQSALGVNVSTTGSLLTTLSLVTVVILSFLVGQLVGSSGGTLFLAEFIVTSISLLLGGAGTISASAMESWGCFFCLSCASFWGYLFGRVSINDGIRRKRGRSYSCMLLSKSIAVLCVFWILVVFVGNWDAPLDLMVLQDSPKSKKHVSKRLQ